MKKHLVASAAVLAMAIPFAATAEINYSFVELDYILQDDDDDTDGFRLKGSYGITDDIFAFGSYTTFDLDQGDFDLLSIGVGYRFGLNEQADLYAGASIERLDIGDDDAVGFGLQLGARYQVIPALELRGELAYIDIDDDPVELDQTLVTVGAQYFVTPAIGLIAEYTVDTDSDGDDGIILGGRFNF